MTDRKNEEEDFAEGARKLTPEKVSISCPMFDWKLKDTLEHFAQAFLGAEEELSWDGSDETDDPQALLGPYVIATYPDTYVLYFSWKAFDDQGILVSDLEELTQSSNLLIILEHLLTDRAKRAFELYQRDPVTYCLGKSRRSFDD